jgi:hypothetical protein
MDSGIDHTIRDPVVASNRYRVVTATIVGDGTTCASGAAILHPDNDLTTAAPHARGDHRRWESEVGGARRRAWRDVRCVSRVRLRRIDERGHHAAAMEPLPTVDAVNMSIGAGFQAGRI